MMAESISSEEDIWDYRPLKKKLRHERHNFSQASNNHVTAASQASSRNKKKLTSAKSQQCRTSNKVVLKDSDDEISSSKSRTRKHGKQTSNKISKLVKTEDSLPPRDETPAGKVGRKREGRCPVCFMPFSILIVQSPNWHVQECLDMPFLSNKECPNGLKCDYTIVSHYKKFRHSIVANRKFLREQEDLQSDQKRSYGNVQSARSKLLFGDEQKQDPGTVFNTQPCPEKCKKVEKFSTFTQPLDSHGVDSAKVTGNLKIPGRKPVEMNIKCSRGSDSSDELPTLSQVNSVHDLPTISQVKTEGVRTDCVCTPDELLRDTEDSEDELDLRDGQRDFSETLFKIMDGGGESSDEEDSKPGVKNESINSETTEPGTDANVTAPESGSELTDVDLKVFLISYENSESSPSQVLPSGRRSQSPLSPSLILKEEIKQEQTKVKGKSPNYSDSIERKFEFDTLRQEEQLFDIDFQEKDLKTEMSTALAPTCHVKSDVDIFNKEPGGFFTSQDNNLSGQPDTSKHNMLPSESNFSEQGKLPHSNSSEGSFFGPRLRARKHEVPNTESLKSEVPVLQERKGIPTSTSQQCTSVKPNSSLCATSNSRSDCMNKPVSKKSQDQAKSNFKRDRLKTSNKGQSSLLSFFATKREDKNNNNCDDFDFIVKSGSSSDSSQTPEKLEAVGKMVQNACSSTPSCSNSSQSLNNILVQQKDDCDKFCDTDAGNGKFQIPYSKSASEILMSNRQNTNHPLKKSVSEVLMANSRKQEAQNSGDSYPLRKPGTRVKGYSTHIKTESEEVPSASYEGQEQDKEQEKGRGWKRQCPFYKKIPDTPFTVDAFRYGVIPGCEVYFLTHFHYDHYCGLTKQFARPIYCSQVTANLVKSKIRVDAHYITALPLETPHIVHGTEVTLLEANHCPGSVLILFKLKSGKVVLHTGDFRACQEMELYPQLVGTKVHSLYLDTTYCDPTYSFPHQQDVINFAVKLAVEAVESNPKILIVCGSYTIGKERVFLAIAEVLGCRVCVNRDKKNILDCLEDNSIKKLISLNWSDSRLHVLPMNKLNPQGLADHLSKNGKDFNSVLALEPTGWTFKKKLISLDQITPKFNRDGIKIYGIPYSEHSSYLELRRFVQFLKPNKILPTVNNGNPASRRKMEIMFEAWMEEVKRGSNQTSGSSQPTLSSWMK